MPLPPPQPSTSSPPPAAAPAPGANSGARPPAPGEPSPAPGPAKARMDFTEMFRRFDSVLQVRGSQHLEVLHEGPEGGPGPAPVVPPPPAVPHAGWLVPGAALPEVSARVMIDAVEMGPEAPPPDPLGPSGCGAAPPAAALYDGAGIVTMADAAGPGPAALSTVEVLRQQRMRRQREMQQLFAQFEALEAVRTDPPLPVAVTRALVTCVAVAAVAAGGRSAGCVTARLRGRATDATVLDQINGGAFVVHSVDIAFEVTPQGRGVCFSFGRRGVRGCHPPPWREE